MKQKRCVKPIFIALLIFLSQLKMEAQDSLYWFKSGGVITGYGHEINIDTRYNPIYFAGDFAWQFGKGKKPNFFAWYLEPQVNLVATVRPVDIEFGTNIGIRYYQHLSSHIYFYEMLGSGPHFITANLPRQAKGFIFSDNFALGLYSCLSKKKVLFLNTQIRFRHISNANIKLPNAGVNAVNVLVGLAKLRL